MSLLTVRLLHTLRMLVFTVLILAYNRTSACIMISFLRQIDTESTIGKTSINYTLSKVSVTIFLLNISMIINAFLSKLRSSYDLKRPLYRFKFQYTTKNRKWVNPFARSVDCWICMPENTGSNASRSNKCFCYIWRRRWDLCNLWRMREIVSSTCLSVIGTPEMSRTPLSW